MGQGGYGEVYLAKHKESHEVVALKKLRKRTLLKMDEVGPFCKGLEGLISGEILMFVCFWRVGGKW